jgi:hypothetical protein
MNVNGRNLNTKVLVSVRDLVSSAFLIPRKGSPDAAFSAVGLLTPACNTSEVTVSLSTLHIAKIIKF